MSAENRVRKSTRQPVPNPIYQQGISELKSENTTRNKRRTKNNQEQNLSYEDQKNSQLYYDHSYNANDSKQPYLPCKMPGGHNMKVRFVVEIKQEQKKKQKEKQYVPPPMPKPVVKTKQSTNLLNLFKQAIQDVDGAQEYPAQQNSVCKPAPQKIQPSKSLAPKPKRNKSQGEDMIKKARIQNGVMKIHHSQLGEIQFPVEWENTQMAHEQDNQTQQIRKRLQNCKALKNISILMT